MLSKIKMSNGVGRNISLTIILLSIVVVLGCQSKYSSNNLEVKEIDNVSIRFKHCERDGSTVTCSLNVSPIYSKTHFFVHYQTSALDEESNQYCIAQIRIGDVFETNKAHCEDHSTAGLIEEKIDTHIEIVFEDVSISAKFFTRLEFRVFAGRNRNVRVMHFTNIKLGADS